MFCDPVSVPLNIWCVFMLPGYFQRVVSGDDFIPAKHSAQPWRTVSAQQVLAAGTVTVAVLALDH